MLDEKTAIKQDEKAPAIQFVPDSIDEYTEIKKAADKTKRSLANFCLRYSLESAQKINREND